MARVLNTHVMVDGQVYEPGTPESDIKGADTVTADVWDGEAGEADGGAKPYAKWVKADLEALVAERNKDRDEADHIVVGGNGTVKDLAAALDADDAASNDEA